ncbi:MAG: MFS transporter [Paracoccaceae bacterium]
MGIDTGLATGAAGIDARTLRRRIWGWMAFDWATQPFYTLGLTFIFGPYFAGVATEYFAAQGMTETVADSRAQSVWSLGQTVAGLLIAATAPLIGAYADSTGRRMPWIVAFSAVYVVAAWSMWLLMPDGTGLWAALIAFAVCLMAAEYALVFVNAQLPSLGGREAIGRISGSGAALGYWGGVLSLFVMLLVFFEADAETGTTLLGAAPPFGLDPEAREGTRIVGPFIALWFALFMIPYFAWVREPRPVTRQGGVRDAMTELGRSLRGVLKRPSLAAYLASSMFYRDALAALYGFGGVYATLVLDWSLTFIALFGILGAVTAGIATYLGGLLDARHGPKPVITGSIVVLIAVCTTIVGMDRSAFFGLPLTPGSSLPDIVFMVCGAAIGGAGGAVQAASRSMMARHADPERPTEAFALYALSGKATAFLAPALIGLVTYLSESPRIGLSPVIGLFLLGLGLLVWVRPEGDTPVPGPSALEVTA